MILIVTNRRDLTSDLVILQLQRRGLSYFRFNTEDLPAGTGLTWSIATSPLVTELLPRQGRIDLASVEAVWYRRPIGPQGLESVQPDAARVFAESETNAARRNLFSVLECFWVSRPEAIQRIDQKMLQLRLASTLGFVIPPTIVTTDPQAVRNFCATFDAVVAKPLGRGFIDENGNGSIIIFANRLSVADRDRLDAVKLAPTMFQQLIPKHCDLRVTVVGQRIFAVEIHSLLGGPFTVDWRREPMEQLRHVPHRLPSLLHNKVLDLVRACNLQFAALDFVVDLDGRYVFLELNPNGQWAWIEQVLGMPISSAIVDLLSGQSSPL